MVYYNADTAFISIFSIYEDTICHKEASLKVTSHFAINYTTVASSLSFQNMHKRGSLKKGSSVLSNTVFLARQLRVAPKMA